LKIAVNTRLLIKDKLEGIGWFTYETLKRITAQHQEHEFIFIFDRAFSDEFIFSDNIKPVVVGPQARHPLLYYTWFEYSIPKVLKKHKPDLFLSPDGYLSLSTDVKSLAVIHDLNFEHHPADLPFPDRKYYRHYFPRFADKAARIATVSEYSKNDIINTYKVDAGKIDVVYNGANESYQPIAADKQAQTRAKYSKGKPYFLFVGALHPRKNLVNLFKAFDEFKTSSSSEMDDEGKTYYYWNDGRIRDLPESEVNKDIAQRIDRDYSYETQLFDSLKNYARSTFAVPISLGLKLKLWRNMEARLASTYYLTASDYIDNLGFGKNKDKFIYTSISFQYTFGNKDTEEGRYEQVDFFTIVLEDTDEDRVIDMDDLCADTPFGVKVDESGCPLDEDDDGVPDYLDKEPDTKKNSPVDENGVTISDEKFEQMLIARDSIPTVSKIIRISHKSEVEKQKKK